MSDFINFMLFWTEHPRLTLVVFLSSMRSFMNTPLFRVSLALALLAFFIGVCKFIAYQEYRQAFKRYCETHKTIFSKKQAKRLYAVYLGHAKDIRERTQGEVVR